MFAALRSRDRRATMYIIVHNTSAIVVGMYLPTILACMTVLEFWVIGTRTDLIHNICDA